MLTLEQYVDYIIDVQGKLGELSKKKLADLDSTLELDIEMLVKFQQWKNEAMFDKIISPEVAQRIYAAMGESVSANNGGWNKGVSTAEKFTSMKLMEEIGKRKIGKKLRRMDA